MKELSICDYTSKIFSKNVDQINEDIKKSKHPKSLKAMLRTIMKIDEILKSIVATKDSFYTNQILARILFEHSLLFQYIFIRVSEDKSDKVGVDYYSSYFMSEFVKRENYNFGIEDIRNNKKEPITLERIQQKYPNLKLIPHQVQQINTTANQFDIRKIADYLNNKTNNTNNFIEVHQQMLEFLIRYNNLSSYVHGGPSSEKTTFEIKLNEHDKLINENILLAEIASYSAKYHIISVLNHEFPATYFPIYTEMSFALKKSQ